MLSITGSQNIWFITDIHDMRKGRRSLLQAVKDRFPNPYNGDIFAFMSKNRRLMKLAKYEDHMFVLYELEYERGYKFMEPVYEHNELRCFELDFKYLVALLKCPVISKLHIYNIKYN